MEVVYKFGSEQLKILWCLFIHIVPVKTRGKELTQPWKRKGKNQLDLCEKKVKSNINWRLPFQHEKLETLVM